MRPAPPPSLWAAITPEPSPVADAALPGDVDVLVVGAGYTGLWTARSLVVADPTVRVAVIEAERVGFGASGRNGGWCSALLPLSVGELARRHGRDQAVSMYRAMFDAVTDVGAFADPSVFHRGGTISLARTPRQLARVTAAADEHARFGIGEDDVRLLTAAEAIAICAATRVEAALFSPHCAAVNPLALTRALADDLRARGVPIVEGCTLGRVRPGAVAETSHGDIRAGVVVLGTEAHTALLPGHRRDILPIYSLMIGSEPLTHEQWETVGLGDRTTFADARHTVIYGQRTADGRLAFGGRGAPYHFGSRIDASFDRHDAVRRRLEATVVELFPALRGVAFDFHWGGALGVPRDWHPHVRFDPASGLASAGGYTGDGVATANLAGRTLADLILGRETDLTRLPWVGHRSPRWEPEPLRWLGVRLSAVAAQRADAADAAGRRTASLWDRVFSALT
jgi:glycine/D-amino acid oxidase-like deaminating enzyme